MTKLVAMDVDFDIHKMVENERRGFDEPQYVALRRLLKLPEAATANESQPAPPTQGRPWREDGVEVPHGSLARMEYDRGRQVYEGQFLDGRLVVNGQSFPSLSAASNAFAITKKGGQTSLNGWVYWKAMLPGETKWRSLNEMREEVRRRARR